MILTAMPEPRTAAMLMGRGVSCLSTAAASILLGGGHLFP